MATSSPTSAKKTTAKKSTARKSAAKKSAAKKSAARKSAAKKSAAKKSTAKRSSASKGSAAGAGRDTVVNDAESAYVSQVFDAGAELTKRWESAGHELLGRLDAISEQHPIDIPRDVLDTFQDAAQSNDAAEFLRAQQACGEALQSSIDSANSSYAEALGEYSASLQDLWSGHAGRHASLFEDYVADVRRRLNEGNGDPAAVAQLGWSLIAASQFASATATRA